jgi:hypothetical protein
MDDDSKLTLVSPKHSVRLASEYLPFLETPPSRDFVVRTITQREHEGTPLMSADIVIAGRETRETLPLARTYPLHFRKTYFPGRLHGDPQHEVDMQQRASDLVGIAPPIGCGPTTFRSCFVPGTPYSRLSPFGVEPDEANLPRAHALKLEAAVGLWSLLERAFAQLSKLHEGGLAHGDAELHNLIVCPSPLDTALIDFEVAIDRSKVSDEVWHKTTHKDLVPLLREAVFLQSRLGPQPGALGELSLARIKECFKDGDRFKREIDWSANQSA